MKQQQEGKQYKIKSKKTAANKAFAARYFISGFEAIQKVRLGYGRATWSATVNEREERHEARGGASEEVVQGADMTTKRVQNPMQHGNAKAT